MKARIKALLLLALGGVFLGASCAAKSATARKQPRAGDPVVVPSSLSDGLTLKRVHRRLKKPVGLEFFQGDPRKRLFVVEQVGRVRAIEGGTVSKEALLDVSTRISTDHMEQGLLGLAFHPNFAENGRLFINYTNRKGRTIVSELRVSEPGAEGSLRVDETPEKVLLEQTQPWRNHNGGYLEFGPDGLLYVGLGDGGAANDPKRVGQKPGARLGKMLRIDVDSGKVAIIQSGLRNPWRYSFDPANGDLYIADVGQDEWEEVSVVSSSQIDGANFGWSVMEGNHCFRKKGCKSEGFVPAAVEYDHQVGCSVTGGVVYRGKAFPRLRGHYFYSDYCTAILRSFRWDKGQVSEHLDWKEALDPKYRLANVSAIEADQEGELYVLSRDGVIHKLVAESAEAR